jgi:hypothetical protein
MQSAVTLVTPKKDSDVNEMGNLKASASEQSGIRPPTLVWQRTLKLRVDALLDNRA